ncbi:MAG: DNA alkylation repair protein [Anaerolineae bacterium]|nr:DNA alkylation repair protein [Anaerolineae bacterium]
MSEPNPRLKDLFFQRPFYDDLVAVLAATWPPFDAEAFWSGLYDAGWDDRSLMERMRHTTVILHSVLPEDFRAALRILQQAAPALAQYGFEKLVLCEYVGLYGLDDWEASLPALEAFTHQASAEFAVRPFILQDLERMLAQMLKWASHDSPTVRRLASEGCRPRLPWGIRLPPLIDDPAPVLPVLEQLKLDEDESVRRSVANNLNDIAKDNPQVVIDVLRRWQAHDTPEMAQLISRALRTLLKAGDPGALELLGYGRDPAITVSNMTLEPDTIPLGETVAFSFDVESTGQQPQDLMIDYVVYLMRANGQQTPKVFKLTKRTIAPGETIHITRKQSFAPQSSRKYYPGEHAIEIQINGTTFDRREFLVT